MPDEPMKVETSIGTPVFCWISATGAMSATTVRAAQFGSSSSPASRISSTRRVTVSTTCGPAPGRPTFT